jgi:2-dehydro-3-deoxyglucarate aldolase
MDGTGPTNRLRERFADDAVALGVLDSAYSPTLVELYGDLGADFVWIDLEHGGPAPEDGRALEELSRAAERTGTELLVRLPDPEPAAVRKALDAGVRSLFLPRVESAATARAAVRAARFRYDDGPGARGLASPRARRWGLVEDYVEAEDRETLVGVTIETEAGVEAVDDVLAVPELGFVFLGPLDLSVSLGHPGDLGHPDVRAAVERVRSATLDAGVPLGGLGFGMDDVNEKAANGYDLLHLGSTTGALTGAVRSWFEAHDGDRPGSS